MDEQRGPRGPKRDFPTIAARNRVFDNIIRSFEERESFLVCGHQSPDEDCVASMVAFALLVTKFAKSAAVFVEGDIPESFDYLKRICRYNSIDVDRETSFENGFDAVVVCDTAKLDMLGSVPQVRELIRDPETLTIEVDHHLGADSEYIGDPGYALVAEATSSSELIGQLAFKVWRRFSDSVDEQFPEVFTRNVVLAILTGIVGDTKMGRFLKTRKELRYYSASTRLFNQLLGEKTVEGSGKFASIEELSEELERLSEEEAACFEEVYREHARKGLVAYLMLAPARYLELTNRFGGDVVSSVLRAVADDLAEESGYVALVAFGGDPEKPNLFQFRCRRSRYYRRLDLRDILERFGIQSGGGHQGAIGFRVESSAVSSLESYVEELIEEIQSLIESSP